MRYFASLDAMDAVSDDGEVHVLDPKERRALLQVQKRAMIRAAAVGAVTAAIAAWVEVVLDRALTAGKHPFGIEHVGSVGFWAVIMVVAVLTTLPELIYLYLNTLRGVHELSHSAGVVIIKDDDDEERTVAGALARAALEVPNPRHPFIGVDPRRETSNWVLLVGALVYRAKVSVTNFVAKALFRRLLSRAVLRAWAPLVAIPVSAIWDALITLKVLREARIRVMGPSAAADLMERILGGELSDNAKEAAFRAVASSIVRTRDLHPNLCSLLESVTEQIGGAPDIEDSDRSERFLRMLPDLNVDDQNTALAVLSVAAVIDGRIGRRERDLVRRALGACDRVIDEGPVRHLAREFVAGNGIDAGEIHALVSRTAHEPQT